MERDMDLIRKILLAMERLPYDPALDDGQSHLDLSGENYSDDEVDYHLVLLSEAGLIEGVSYAKSEHMNGIRPLRLTWGGHEFLEASRNEGAWNRAKALIKDKGGNMVFGVLEAVLVRIMMDRVLGTNTL